MIRVLNFVMIALTITICFGLYKITNESRATQKELDALNEKVVAEQNAITVLKAEWSYLAQPSRLQELSGKFLGLQAVSSTQIGTISKIPFRTETRGVVVEPAREEQLPPIKPQRKQRRYPRAQG
jgi:cell division protein FtsL